MLTKIRTYLPVFLIGLLLSISLLIAVRTLSFRFDTDYKVILPLIHFALDEVRDPVRYFSWNPFIGLGTPVTGDPSSVLFSPWYMPVFVVFGVNWGLRILIVLSILVSGFTMWVFLSSLPVRSWVASWGAILYETSGGLAALVTSGRLERFGSFAVTPYVFYLILNEEISAAHMIVIGLLYACMYLSMDVYTPWLISILYIAVSFYKRIHHSRTLKQLCIEAGIIYGTFIVFSLPKLLPFVLYIRPYFQRSWFIDAFAGSLNIWLLPLPYIVPWRVAFYDRPFFQRTLGFYFNWYEYYAFISFLPFIFLLKIRNVWKNPFVRLLLLILFVGGLYLSLKYPYSPFYWIFHAIPLAQTFRVPQRIAGIILVPIIALICLCADFWIKNAKPKHRTYLLMLCLLSILWTGIQSFRTMRDAFEPFRVSEYSVASELRQKDPSSYYVLNLQCCIQPFLIDQSIPIINFYGGWMPTYTPKFTDPTGNSYDLRQLSITKPSYIIADKSWTLGIYGYDVYFQRDGISVWKAKQPTIFPNL